MSRKISTKVEYLIFASKINTLIDEKESGNKDLFAQKIGCSYETVRRWCLGNNLPDGNQLLELYKIYNISLDWLLTDTEKKTGELELWSQQTQDACRALKRIIESPDKKTARALLSNLEAFSISLDRFKEQQENDDKFKDLKNNSDIMKQELVELREAVKRLTDTALAKQNTGID